MAAAVADFRPRSPPPTKLGRGDGLTLELEPTEDILAEAAATAARAAHAAHREHGRCIVGFAAETGSLERAPEKAARKGVDLLVANESSEAGLRLRHRHQPGHDRRAPGSTPSRGR